MIETNHAKAPVMAAFVASMREAFGSDQVKVIYISENGVLYGKPSDRGASCLYMGSGVAVPSRGNEK